MDDPADPAVMTVEQLAEYVGIHTTTIYRLAEGGKIPYFRMGSVYRFRPDELDLWMKNRNR